MDAGTLDVKSIVEPAYFNRFGRRSEASVLRRSKNVRGENFTKPKRRKK